MLLDQKSVSGNAEIHIRVACPANVIYKTRVLSGQSITSLRPRSSKSSEGPAARMEPLQLPL